MPDTDLLNPLTSTDSRRNLLIKALLVFALFQAIYWSIFIPLNKPSPVPRDEIVTQFEFAKLDAPTLEAAANADFTPIKAGETKMADAPSYYAFRAKFNAPENLDYNIGLGPLVNADNFHVFVNGFPVSTRGHLEYPSSYYALKPEIFEMSRGLAMAGDNEVLIIAARNRMPRVSINAMLVGNYDQIMEATKRKRFLFGPYRFISLLIISLVLLIAAIMYPQTQNKPTFFWLVILSAGLLMRSLIFFYYGTFGSEFNRMMVYFAGTNLVALGWLNYIDAWTGKGFKRLRTIATLVTVLAIAIIAILIARDFVPGFLMAEKITEAIMAAGALGALARLGWHLYKTREDRVWELGALAVSVTLLVWDTYGFIVLKSDLGHMKIAAPLILIALLAAGLSRNLRIYESMGALNDHLQDTLKVKEDEIKARYKELEDTRRQRDIANERQRILRDMHDGIGAQLVVLLSAARSGKLKPKTLQQAISQTLTDLRLMIDSLDSVSSDFAVALGTFRSRIMPTLTSAGFTLNWDLDGLPLGTTIPPKTILNVYRILQEAIANSLKHAEADEIYVSVNPTADKDGRSYDIQIGDNGKGRTKGAAKGQGLDSMKRRAADIGADIQFLDTDTGLKVLITGIKIEPA